MKAAKKQEALALLSDPSEEAAPASNCAWCGDPPNEYGSHGICPYHAAWVLEQSRRRREAKEAAL
jgi:hypothetical protein